MPQYIHHDVKGIIARLRKNLGAWHPVCLWKSILPLSVFFRHSCRNFRHFRVIWEKTVSTDASPVFFSILSPSSPILGQNCFILRSALQTKSAWHPHSMEPTFSQACIIAPPSVAFCGILENIICYDAYNICKIIAYTGCLRKNALSECYRASSGQKPSVVIMIGISECACGSVFDPKMLCSILKVRFFWDTLYIV